MKHNPRTECWCLSQPGRVPAISGPTAPHTSLVQLDFRPHFGWASAIEREERTVAA